jgi:voltage-gated potassium channel Kch
MLVRCRFWAGIVGGLVFLWRLWVGELRAGSRGWAAAWGIPLERELARWLGVLGVAAVALALGYVGLNEYLSRQAMPEFGRGWADVLFYDLQLFVFNAAPSQGAGPFPVALGIARFLAPASTALAGVETVRLLLGEQLRRWVSATASGHAIVTGDGPVAVELARRLREERRKVVLVSASQATVEQGRRHRLLDVCGDPTDPGTLRAAGIRRADVLYACADLGTTSAATALRARGFSRAVGRPLVAYAQVRDAEVCAALRARRIGAAGDLLFRLDFFSVEDAAARVLLDRYPVTPSGGQPAQVVIIGFGRLGRAVLREIARRPAPGGPPAGVTVLGAAAEEVRDFADRFPVIRRNCSLSCREESVPGTGSCLVLVCLPGNDDALSAGLAAAHSLAGRPGQVVICMSEPSPFGAELSGQGAMLDNVGGRLTVFGVIEEACVPRKIREDLTDQLARAIHRAYVRNCAARGDSLLVNQAMRPWEELPDDLRDANLAQAAHIGVKLEAINCAVIPESATAPDFAFTAAETEFLAEMEHLRWMLERRAQGYVQGPAKEGRQHPDLIDWQYLSDSTRDKDRDVIRELPAILKDAGFQILRLPTQPA